ncbi:Oidioi.mRNA.OKI2018_I69.chr2.g8368.t1.cds [Oikopleura dioica]|uniref:Oidioi.mRNA.OKI2018_I69.chr2.g8368.t1.cds n=1 Tax=Oikopleura dioica TaxID=34765 RepID=A0ABN7T910_OIKDI|nr:Oidioi.mRNA.OKI2018_I69.chr2.g8368.t1.cds [Oikopleura dioica]
MRDRQDSQGLRPYRSIPRYGQADVPPKYKRGNPPPRYQELESSSRRDIVVQVIPEDGTPAGRGPRPSNAGNPVVPKKRSKKSSSGGIVVVLLTLCLILKLAGKLALSKANSSSNSSSYHALERTSTPYNPYAGVKWGHNQEEIQTAEIAEIFGKHFADRFYGDLTNRIPSETPETPTNETTIEMIRSMSNETETLDMGNVNGTYSIPISWDDIEITYEFEYIDREIFDKLGEGANQERQSGAAAQMQESGSIIIPMHFYGDPSDIKEEALDLMQKIGEEITSNAGSLD